MDELYSGSHPMRVRGLKYSQINRRPAAEMSHPMRVRGLKSVASGSEEQPRLVAPHAGAWIEMLTWLPLMFSILSRTPCGCVD